MFDDESTKHADIVLPAESYAEKEGTVTHPDGRLQRVRPNVPLPENTRPGWWICSELLARARRRLGVGTPEEVFALACQEVPFYGETAYEEIGGQGLRWAERDPGASWTAGDGAVAAGADSPVAARPRANRAAYAPSSPTDRTASCSAPTATSGPPRSPSATRRLRFLMPTQRLETAPGRRRRRSSLEHGDPVTVTADGASVEAFVSRQVPDAARAPRS